jgi:uncharacterized protein YqjF (DUF2071 family)
MDVGAVELPERLWMTRRPAARVIGYQRWDRIAFFHWPLPPEALRPLVPPRLAIDTHDGQAWVSLTPFTLVGGRLRFTPPLPLVSTFHEVNLRTYVHLDGRAPGLWFFSLDAASALAVAAARGTLRLPYFPARIRRDRQGDAQRYESRRLVPARPPAVLRATWRVGGDLPPAEPGTLDHFLLERYVLYSRGFRAALLRGRVHHRPWPLRAASVEALEESLTSAAGLPPPSGAPLAHCSDGVDVEFFPFTLA